MTIFSIKILNYLQKPKYLFGNYLQKPRHYFGNILSKNPRTIGWTIILSKTKVINTWRNIMS